jgi:ferredoxin
MAREAARAGVPWHLAYGGRTRASMPFVDEALALPGGDVTLVPQDTDGLLPVADVVARAARDGADVYCCGPAGLLDAVLAEGERALGPGRVHVERFTPVEVVPDGPDRAFEVEVASLGLTVAVPADRTVLEALEDAGVQILSSCREGTCGTCELTVLDGAVDHRDSLLTAAEQAADDTMFPCVSRAAGARLVVDL